MLLIDVLLAELKLFGVKQLFGIPGDFILPLFEQLQQQSSLPLYCLSHEPSVVFAADAAARISNGPSVALLTYGAGALNAVNAVAQAYAEHVPLVVIAGFPGAAELNHGLQIHHQAKTTDSQRDIFQQITACQVRLDNPDRIGHDLRLAFTTAKEQSLPVLIEIPRDAVQFTAVAAGRYCPPPVPQDELMLVSQHLMELVAGAKKPVILAGVDVRRFDAVLELEQWVLLLNIPFVSTLMGRASFNQQHPMYQGIFLDKSDLRPAQLLRDADLILLIGVIKTDSNFAAHSELFPPEKLICLEQNRQQLELATYHQVGLKPLLNAMLQQQLPAFQTRQMITAEERTPDDVMTASNVVLRLDRILSQQRQRVPLISDIGDCLFASLHASPSLLLAPAFYASMGYAIPAALGVQAATGLRPVVLVGDGAFLMTGLELGHCKRYGFSPVVILFNNHCWDMINAFSPSLNCTAIHHWQYAGLAANMGGTGVVVNSLPQFEQALIQAMADQQHFTLIEVKLAAGSRTKRLNNFADGFLAAQGEMLKC